MGIFYPKNILVKLTRTKNCAVLNPELFCPAEQRILKVCFHQPTELWNLDHPCLYFYVQNYIIMSNLGLFAMQLQHCRTAAGSRIFKFSSFFFALWRQKCSKWLFRKTLCVFGVSHLYFIFWIAWCLQQGFFGVKRENVHPFLTWLIVNGKAGKELFM